MILSVESIQGRHFAVDLSSTRWGFTQLMKLFLSPEQLGFLDMLYVDVCESQLHTLSHLSDLLTHQRKQPDVKQHLPRRGQGLEVDHQHHGKQEEEGEVKHDIPVELDLRTAVQAG